MTIEELIAQAESGLTAQFARIDRMEEIGTRRVLDAFREHQVAYRHFAPTTGYGYDDLGRDKLDEIKRLVQKKSRPYRKEPYKHGKEGLNHEPNAE